MSESIITRDEVFAPEAFTQEPLGWLPWLEPLPKSEFTDRHWDGVVEKQRADMPYFALLARDPEILKARTLTDVDIFYNTTGGAPRAERELAAAATSRLNGCVFCASVHARFATEQSGRRDEVQQLLDDGVNAVTEPRWAAVVEASVALTQVPSEFGQENITALRAQGLADEEISDVIHGAAFFNWANRLMLSLGEPEIPARRR